MIFRRIRQHLREQNWIAVMLDLLIVVVGLFLGFQVDRWYEGQKDQKLEVSYLERLKSDMQREIELFDEAIGWADRRIEAALLLERVIEAPETAFENPNSFVSSLERAGWTSFPHISRFVYSEMQSTGLFMLLRSEPLRRALADHYANLDHAERMALGRDLQIAYEHEIAGVLSSNILIAIEEGRSNDLEFHEQELHAITTGFAGREKAISLLPELIQHNVYSRELNNRGKAEAAEIIRMIDELLGQR